MLRQLKCIYIKPHHDFYAISSSHVNHSLLSLPSHQKGNKSHISPSQGHKTGPKGQTSLSHHADETNHNHVSKTRPNHGKKLEINTNIEMYLNHDPNESHDGQTSILTPSNVATTLSPNEIKLPTISMTPIRSSSDTSTPSQTVAAPSNSLASPSHGLAAPSSMPTITKRAVSFRTETPSNNKPGQSLLVSPLNSKGSPSSGNGSTSQTATMTSSPSISSQKSKSDAPSTPPTASISSPKNKTPKSNRNSLISIVESSKQANGPNQASGTSLKAPNSNGTTSSGRKADESLKISKSTKSNRNSFISESTKSTTKTRSPSNAAVTASAGASGSAAASPASSPGNGRQSNEIKDLSKGKPMSEGMNMLTRLPSLESAKDSDIFPIASLLLQNDEEIPPSIHELSNITAQLAVETVLTTVDSIESLHHPTPPDSMNFPSSRSNAGHRHGSMLRQSPLASSSMKMN